MLLAVQKKIKSAPDSPGVYMMKTAEGQIIYIGKAKSLKRRLSDYLLKDLPVKTLALIDKVYDIDYLVCKNENMALLLESALIRKHKPRYNISLRDDKSFPFVKITEEEFPAVYITRKRQSDGGVYLGPYTNAKMLREALKIIRRVFPYRSCRRLPKKPCIYYRLKLSPAPCIGKISKRSYTETIRNVCLILEGKSDALIAKLSEKMKLASRDLRFEEAAVIRDQINALSRVTKADTQVPGRHSEILSLKEELHLAKLPQRIEAFDISNISGKEACGSMVSFLGGQPDKNNYRRFRIKTVKGIDDYAMLSEVIFRRYSRLIKEGARAPELILIDGGRSHLLTAKRILDKLGLRPDLLSIAKEKENLYVRDRKKPLRLPYDSAGMNLIRRIRDEAHRFAISYHHILRRKRVLGK